MASWTLDHDAVLVLALHAVGSALSDDLSVLYLAGFIITFLQLHTNAVAAPRPGTRLQDLSVIDPVGLPSRKGHHHSSSELKR